MKKLLLFLVVFVLGLGSGAAGVIFLMPSLVGKGSGVTVQARSFHVSQAVSVTESGVESNLSDGNHYVRMDVEFLVMPQALSAQGGKASGSGSGGTGSAVLDARIRNALIDLCRSTSYTSLTSSGGLSRFKANVLGQLEVIFGPGTVGHVYFPSILTQ